MSAERIRLLLIEDKISEARLIRMTLATAKNAAFDLMGANCLSAGLDLLSREQVDIVLLDLSLPDSQGVDTLQAVRSAAPEVPVVVLLDAGDDEMAKTALSKGACDYLVRRSMTISVLEHCILHTIERSRVAVESGHGEKYFRALIENAPVAILILDEKGIMRYYSSSMKHILGYDEDENIGKSIFDFVHPDDLSANIEVFTKLVSQPGNTYVTELRGRHKDGSWRYVEVLGINHLQTPGVGGIVINFRDITDRRQVESELRETEKRYRAIFDNPLNIIYVIDEGGVVLEANDWALQCLGFTREDVGKTSLMDLVHPEDLQRAMAGVLEAASTGHNEHPIEVRVFTKTGEMIWVESAGFSIEKDGQHFKNLAIARDVTERKRAEERMREAERRYQAIFDNPLSMVFVHDEKGVFLDANDYALERLGCRREDLGNVSFQEMLQVEDALLALQAVSEAMIQGYMNKPVELRVKTKAGETMWLETYGYKLEQDGEHFQCLAIVRDVTESKRAEEALRESEQRYRLLAENITDVIWTLDTTLKTTYVSPSVTRQRGYTVEEAMALPLEKQTSPETMDMIRRVIAEELALEFSGQADSAGWRRGEGIAYRKDGAEFWVEVTASFLRNPEGQVVGVMGVTRDITERKKAEEALRESEERFRTLIENAQDGISIAEPDGTMRYVSTSTERILGFKPEELVGKNVTEFLHPDDVYNAFEPRPRLLGEPETLMSQIYRLRHKDGSWRVIEATNKNLLEDPKVRGIVSNFRDITERKEGEESLARYAAELMCSNKELEQFAFIASHDLQEPLRLMRIYVQLFAKRYQGKLDSDADEFVGYIVSSARRMQELIDGLLAYSLVVVPGKEVQEVDCEATLDRALGSLHTAVEESGVVVTHGSLPHVIGDGLQLEQLFQNLIDNAIKFRSEDTPRIHVSAEEKAGEWIFSVQDNGIGIDPEFAERIFVVFKRLHREEDYPGAGVGLTLCRKIVERHNGRIWVESEAGKGAKFRFTIPVSGVEHP